MLLTIDPTSRLIRKVGGSMHLDGSSTLTRIGSQKLIFTKEEADRTVEIISRITDVSSAKISKLTRKIDAIQSHIQPIQEIETLLSYSDEKQDFEAVIEDEEPAKETPGHLQLASTEDETENTQALYIQQLYREIDTEIDRWFDKVKKLGAEPKGLWLVDFDNGNGFYCWKYPEKKIYFYHGYQDGYLGRKKIEDGEMI